jgi:hypothetical protein
MFFFISSKSNPRCCTAELSDIGDGSHKDNFGESLETLSAIESQMWVYFKNPRFINPKALATDFFPALSPNKTKKQN